MSPNEKSPSEPLRTYSGSYGIAECHGRLFRAMTSEERINFLDKLDTGEKTICRFMHDAPDLAPKNGPYCNKTNGTCSIRSFRDAPDGIQFGPIAATCPYRFLEGNIVTQEIGKILLGTPAPLIAKEVPFLHRTKKMAHQSKSAQENEPPADTIPDTDAGLAKEGVGKIDMVCVHPGDKPLNWCAVEIQAVYFSGKALDNDFPIMRAYSGNSVPLPGARRHPDFRSSGPKRLMPQLQIKVPTLRRWGKKMAVVVDKPFFEALSSMEKVKDISNADIAWVIVRYDDDLPSGMARMAIHDVQFTTLEHAVEGLTGGVPATLQEFEQKIMDKLGLNG